MKEFIECYKIKVILLIYGIITIPVFVSEIENGLVGSYHYFLNKVVSMPNIIFGRDVVFTYGPLGFLAKPMGISGCIWFASIIYLALYFGQFILMYRLVNKYGISLYQLVLTTVVLFLTNLSLIADIFLQYCLFLAMVVLWKNTKDNFAGIFFLFAFPIVFFYKFSVAVACLSGVVIFVATKLALNQRERLWIFLTPIITVPLGYMIYNPSISDFISYLKGSWHMTKGFSTDMSTGANDRYVYWVFFYMLIYVFIWISQLIAKNHNNVSVLLWMAPSLFMSYKHGYVRADIHSVVGYAEILSELAILILVFDVMEFGELFAGKIKRIPIRLGLVFVLLVSCLLNYETEIHPLQSLRNNIHNLSSIVYWMQEDNVQENAEHLTALPPGFITEIGTSSFTSFPVEISFIEKRFENSDANISKQFVPIYGVQDVTVVTDYLDAETARRIIGDKGPRYLIFRFSTIDNRIPLIEVPLTWKAILDNYEIAIYDEDKQFYLLKRLDNCREDRKADRVDSLSFEQNSDIEIAGADEIKISADLSVWGKIAEFLWKVPEVDMTITYADGTVKSGRVLMNMLSSGITTDYLPYDNKTLENSLERGKSNCAIEKVRLHGRGLKYYKKEISVDYLYY